MSGDNAFRVIVDLIHIACAAAIKYIKIPLLISDCYPTNNIPIACICSDARLTRPLLTLNKSTMS